VALFDFDLLATDPSSHARRGCLHTAHGDVQTPTFMPVGTRAAVKGVTVDRLHSLDAQVVLSNTYHLYLRPGAELVEKAGGLHRFMNWDRPILTDSGGFQIFSLADTLKLDDDGVAFRSIIDGSKHYWTPEDNMHIQQQLGADIAMQLDQCAPYPAEKDFVETAVERSAAWARRCRKAHTRSDQALFGIVQGGVHLDLRLQSVEMLARIVAEEGAFEGYGIGGYSVGESHEQMFETLGTVACALPRDRPHYLMGVGNPTTLVRAVGEGVDLFDCVLPTRTARMNTAFSSEGRLNLKNARFKEDFGPLDPQCTCPVCRGYTRAYLHHLVICKEMGASILLSVHNLHYLIDLMRRAREAIETGTYAEFMTRWADSPAANDF
jgi:queuine tRNA-ribosyltransferase